MGRWQRTAWAAFLGHLVLALYMVEGVRLNADEGWYLYAAGRVAEGLKLHQDLLFYQPPVMPYVYGGMLDFGPGMLLGARWISMFFMVLAVGLLGLTALRLAGLRAAALVIALVGLHPMVVGTGVWAKPYALSLLLVSGGLFVWSGSQRPARVMAGALLLGLSAGVRLSLLPVPLVAIWAARRRGWAALGAVMGLLLAYRPVLGVPLPMLWEQLVTVHLPEASGGWALAGDRLALLARLGFLLGGFLTVAVLSRLGRGSSRGPVERLCLGATLITGLLHLVPGVLHVEHAVVLIPFIGVLAGLWSKRIPDKPWAWANVIGWAGLGCLAALHFVSVDREHSTLEQASEIGQLIRAEVPADRTLLTLQTTLAVESGLRVPQGFEMGRFGWSLGSLDRDRVVWAMGGDVGAVALAEGDFADDPILRMALERAAVQVGRTQSVARFGQFGEPLLLGLPMAPSAVHPETAP